MPTDQSHTRVRVIVSPSDIEVRLRANGIEELALDLRSDMPEKVAAWASRR